MSDEQAELRRDLDQMNFAYEHARNNYKMADQCARDREVQILRLLRERDELVEALEEFLECSPCRNGCAPNDMTCLTNRSRARLNRIKGEA